MAIIEKGAQSGRRLADLELPFSLALWDFALILVNLWLRDLLAELSNLIPKDFIFEYDQAMGLALSTPYKLINTTSTYDYYTTLSYCSPPSETDIPTNLALKRQRAKLQALMNNKLSTYLSALPSSLPQVYKDAITITKTLGIDYLWVDALCIRQDNNLEKGIQTPKMGEIYSKGYVTIAIA
ncbi:heterokaryon incompatibility protein-domain-containing protein [Aspergillus floccosus]